MADDENTTLSFEISISNLSLTNCVVVHDKRFKLKYSKYIALQRDDKAIKGYYCAAE